MTKIFTNSEEFWASASAQLLPIMPTHTPQTRFAKPTMMPDANIEYPALIDSAAYVFADGTLSNFVCRMIATITPYMATASQNITLIRFFDVIRGALTAAPIRLLPVIYMPHAAPKTDTPMAIAMPTAENA
eukprot:Gb_35805 [translate_table: standard]